jgi:large subunit ribosomal protein L32
MAVPKKKTSSSRTRQRRAHDALKPINVVIDSKTGEPKLPHHVSLEDGYYKGKQIMVPKHLKEKSQKEKNA